VKFWDTSAIVPLCIDEPASRELRRVAMDDGRIVVWWSTRTECVSAFARQRRDRHIKPAAETQARRLLKELGTAWAEVAPSEALRQRTERLLAIHVLRAADAFQLAAALLWSRGRTDDHDFVCLDDRLRTAAEREGFRVLPG
jgi:uncharacterized protein with PIN domain